MAPSFSCGSLVVGTGRQEKKPGSLAGIKKRELSVVLWQASVLMVPSTQAVRHLSPSECGVRDGGGAHSCKYAAMP